MKLYSIGITIHATAYVRAMSAKKAKAIATAELTGNVVTLENDDCEIVSDEPYETVPDVSLSPAATVGDIDGEPEEVDG